MENSNQSIDLSKYKTKQLDSLYAALVKGKSKDPLMEMIKEEIKKRVTSKKEIKED